jgi:hypothetical protein
MFAIVNDRRNVRGVRHQFLYVQIFIIRRSCSPPLGEQVSVKAMFAPKRPEPHAGVLEIEPYVPGSNATPQGATVFKLSSNETPLGPSLNAVCA